MSVQTSRHGRTLVVRIDREHKRNALNAEVTAGIDRAMNELEDDPDLWSGVLTGGTAVFSAGADLASGPGEPTERGGLVGIIHRKRAKPLIAAVEGLALGGGVELVLCCDMVVASRTARFGLPEVKRGLMPDFGGAFRITRVLPANIAYELLATGDDLTAERAERLGLVNRLTEPGEALDGALALAERVNANAPLAVRAALGHRPPRGLPGRDRRLGAQRRRPPQAAEDGRPRRGHRGVLRTPTAHLDRALITGPRAHRPRGRGGGEPRGPAGSAPCTAVHGAAPPVPAAGVGDAAAWEAGLQFEPGIGPAITLADRFPMPRPRHPVPSRLRGRQASASASSSAARRGPSHVRRPAASSGV